MILETLYENTKNEICFEGGSPEIALNNLQTSLVINEATLMKDYYYAKLKEDSMYLQESLNDFKKKVLKIIDKLVEMLTSLKNFIKEKVLKVFEKLKKHFKGKSFNSKTMYRRWSKIKVFIENCRTIINTGVKKLDVFSKISSDKGSLDDYMKNYKDDLEEYNDKVDSAYSKIDDYFKDDKTMEAEVIQAGKFFLEATQQLSTIACVIVSDIDYAKQTVIKLKKNLEKSSDEDSAKYNKLVSFSAIISSSFSKLIKYVEREQNAITEMVKSPDEE